ncbi:hypothetical protein N7474_001507 [Penicillium riverlandense]|uniref:uncharacterized protein n=1 Tax=Penicillium riverlandense TaxID=1903569 RepID=UPI002547EF6D|nr:uncharacterized protein N7474_001507 [Penicillium riverlandense]KAJ5833196.1 hypothetical protein N7474_001507 [Penicillium riverlandense]
MAQAPPTASAPLTMSAVASVLDAEKRASSPPKATPKLRSCVVCRSRKVRCDKKSPCSNCRRANITCVFPSADRPPRWARRLISNQQAAQGAPVADHIMERIHSLETLVTELRGQLEQANLTGGSSAVHSPDSSSQGPDPVHQENASSTHEGNVQKQFGRLVLQDASQSRYFSSGFWSRVTDELDGLKMDTRGLLLGDSDSSDDDTSTRKTQSTQELGRTPSERHAFLFRHNLSPFIPDLREFHPLPSQIPFLLDVFCENVNVFAQIVHRPSVEKMVRELRGSDLTSLKPGNEALIFSIYYAAITSMEDDDVIINFGSTKAELNLKFRLGLEHALARADFFNVPDLVLVQAFAIFLALVRRHDSPRFVWMMTGMAIRMGQALGLHRDGTNFKHLTPFEIEMRRRVWWVLCFLDVRASEDQGMDVTIAAGTYDTKRPLNINEGDLHPDLKEMPPEREGLTDTSIMRISINMCEITRQMMAPSFKNQAPSMEEQSRLLNGYYEILEREFLQYSTKSGNISYWVQVTVAQIWMAKMTLLTYLPVLFSSPSEHFSDELRSKLLVAAIEVAEYNHALNSEQACRHWRWLFQTYTHWHAVVYLLIEITRRPWSPLVERAWVALHSVWLIPTQSHMDKNLRIWFPLRKLMGQARQHREMELERLRGDAPAAEHLEREDRKMPVPSSSPGLSSAKDANAAEFFIKRWHHLLVPVPAGAGCTSSATARVPGDNATRAASLSDPFFGTNIDPQSDMESRSQSAVEPTYHAGSHSGQNLSSAASNDFGPALSTTTPMDPFNVNNPSPAHQAGVVPWLWADNSAPAEFSSLDIPMDLDGEVDWYNWVESAKEVEWDTGRA